MISVLRWVGSRPAMLALLLAAWPSYSASAGKLVLVSGEVLNGKLVGFENGNIIFQSDRFGKLGVSINAITELQSTDPVGIEFTNGDRVIIRAARSTPSGLAVTTSYGTTTLRWNEIVGVNDIPSASTASNSEKATPPPPPPAPTDSPNSPVSSQTPRNEISLAFAVAGNQTTSILGGTSRDYLSTLQFGYTRSIDDTWSVGLKAPIFYDTRRTIDSTGDNNARRAGLGDLSLFGSKLIKPGEDWPYIKIVANGKLPTGPTGGPNQTTVLGLTSGNWAAGSEVHLQMPVVSGSFLASGGYTQYWPAGNNAIRLRHEFEWAVGHALILSSKWQWTNTVSGSILNGNFPRSEPVYLNTSLSYATDSGYVLRPTISHGLNSDAHDFILGFSVDKRL